MLDNKICFELARAGAKLPSKRHEDGCYDVYACIDEPIVIKPGETALVPTGLKSTFSPRYRIALRERGSNTKSNLIVMAGQIDSGYRGEWFVALHNGNRMLNVRIYPGEIPDCVQEVNLFEGWINCPGTKAICQFAVEYVPDIDVVEIDSVAAFASERGEGKLGSSGK